MVSDPSSHQHSNLSKQSAQGKPANLDRHLFSASNVGALTNSIGFRAILYCQCARNPRTNIGNYSASTLCPACSDSSVAVLWVAKELLSRDCSRRNREPPNNPSLPCPLTKRKPEREREKQKQESKILTISKVISHPLRSDPAICSLAWQKHAFRHALGLTTNALTCTFVGIVGMWPPTIPFSWYSGS